MYQAPEKPVERPKQTVSDRLAADLEIGEAVGQYIGDHFANRPVLAVKGKNGTTAQDHAESIISRCSTDLVPEMTRPAVHPYSPVLVENGGDKLVHGSGGISQPRAE